MWLFSKGHGSPSWEWESAAWSNGHRDRIIGWIIPPVAGSFGLSSRVGLQFPGGTFPEASHRAITPPACADGLSRLNWKLINNSYLHDLTSHSEYIIDGSSLSVHADLDVPGQETFDIAVAGEMASLVAGENGRQSGFKSPIHTVQNKRHLKCLVQIPGHDILGMPVDNGNEVHPYLGQPDTRNVDPPNVVRILGGDIPEEIRIEIVFQGAFTEIGTGINSFNSHFPHICLDQEKILPLK